MLEVVEEDRCEQMLTATVQPTAATSKSEGKRAADDDAEQGGDAKKAKVSSDETSAAPTPARPVEA
jgi:hypothetical protein